MTWQPSTWAAACGCLSALVALVAITGHATSNPWMASWSPDRIPQMVMTSWLLICLSVAIVAATRPATWMARCAIAAAGIVLAAQCAEYAGIWSGLCSGFRCSPGFVDPRSGQASPLTLIAGALDGSAILSTTFSRYRTARWLEAASVVVLGAAAGLHFLGTDALWERTGRNDMALPTAACFLLVTAGTFLVAANRHLHEIRIRLARVGRLRRIEATLRRLER